MKLQEIQSYYINSEGAASNPLSAKNATIHTSSTQRNTGFLKLEGSSQSIHDSKYTPTNYPLLKEAVKNLKYNINNP